MKTPHYLLLGGATVLLSSCGSLNSVQQPSLDGTFDPLRTPGKKRSKGQTSFAASTSTYTPGQWVETSMPNSTFFRVIPKGNATADKVLGPGVPLKYISSEGSYAKVELDSGDVGYVPEIMVIGRAAGGTLVAGGTTSPPPVGDIVVPSSDPFIPPSSISPPNVPDDSVLPEIPTLPSTPVAPLTVPEPPVIPDVPVPGAEDVPDDPTPVEVPVPPDVSGITEPKVTD
jgi:hypothetical protein